MSLILFESVFSWTASVTDRSYDLWPDRWPDLTWPGLLVRSSGHDRIARSVSWSYDRKLEKRPKNAPLRIAFLSKILKFLEKILNFNGKISLKIPFSPEKKKVFTKLPFTIFKFSSILYWYFYFFEIFRKYRKIWVFNKTWNFEKIKIPKVKHKILHNGFL